MPRFLPRLRQLLARGETLTSAGRKLGISKSSAQRWIALYGMDAVGRRHEKPRTTAEQRSLIRELAGEGRSVSYIARRAAVSRSTVRRYAKSPSDYYRCPSCGGMTNTRPCLLCLVSGT